MSLFLKFDPKTIEHLGVKMYSTLPPALAELISNSYDADANEVVIEFHEQNGTPTAITLQDNGIGMSYADIQEKFLVIGRNRREKEGDKPSKIYGRLPTGKKGLGKLALFGLANEISVDTTQDNLRNKFQLNWSDLLTSSEIYNPEVIITNKEVKNKPRTIIQLNSLKRKSPFNLEAIADSLCKIFIVDDNFNIKLKGPNDQEIIISNTRRYSNIEQQFSWTENDLIKKDDPYFGKIKISLITGKTPIPPSAGLRGVALFSRGKLVNAPEYFSESNSSHFYQYLTGSITADFIDLLDEDVISTNRQSLNWDHPEMQEFKKYLAKIILEVGNDWRKKRADKKDKEIENSTGINKEKWFSTLPPDLKDSVESIVKKMGDSEEVSETFTPVIQALYKIVPEYPLLHWRHLHDSLREGVREYYENGQYGIAADQGAKLYAARIKNISNLDEDGSALGKLFSFDCDQKSRAITRPPAIPLNDLSTESLRNIQSGQVQLTMGLMQGFRNPLNHGPMSTIVPDLISEIDCLNVLSLVSYLTTKLDYAEENLKSA